MKKSHFLVIADFLCDFWWSFRLGLGIPFRSLGSPLNLGDPWRPLVTIGDMLENGHFGGILSECKFLCLSRKLKSCDYFVVEKKTWNSENQLPIHVAVIYCAFMFSKGQTQSKWFNGDKKNAIWDGGSTIPYYN